MIPAVTVVIPAWNHPDLLRECLAALAQQTFRDFTVLVVDDGSTQDLRAAVKEAFPSATVLRHEENRGFACAANTGVRSASSEFVFLLNNDVTLRPDSLERLVERLRKRDAYMACPLLLFHEAPNVVYSAGDRQRADGRPEAIGFRESLDRFIAPSEVFGVSAACALYRLELFDKIGDFDERFTAYFEDSDLNFRARLAGFHAVCVAEARAYHVGSASLGERTWWRSRQCYRNHALILLKNMPFRLLVRYAPAIMRERRHQAAMLIRAARAEFGLIRALWSLITARWEILRLLPHALRERRQIQHGRKLSDAELEALLTV